MSEKNFKIRANTSVKSCPECNNNTEFVAKSEQVSEDGCEVWIECKCGFDPHTIHDRMESVMGRLDEDNIREAIGFWNDASLHSSELANSKT